jgi:ComF family protein
MDCATVSQTAVQWLWPETCAHCREDLSGVRPGPLCPGCRLTLAPSEPPYCARCAEPTNRPLCARCEGRPFACRTLRGAFLYKGAAVSLVHAFKFRGRRGAARAAGAWMGQAFSRFPELARAQALVPMPLHPRRRRERGYNQARLIAESLSDWTGLPVWDVAARVKATRPLWALGRESREQTLVDAFRASPSVKGRSLLVVDDVCTSGASLEGCARALVEAGAAWAGGYAFARQWQPLIT